MDSREFLEKHRMLASEGCDPNEEMLIILVEENPPIKKKQRLAFLKQIEEAQVGEGSQAIPDRHVPRSDRLPPECDAIVDFEELASLDAESIE